MATCYRHPDRETGVSCSNCGRPICPDCMTPTAVGMRCPECAQQTTKVKTIGSMNAEPRVTFALIAINVILFLASGQFGVQGGNGSRLYYDLALFGPSIDIQHEYWRLITGGFLHAGFLHIGFNMYLLYILGQMLESTMGSVRFGLLYFAALLAGSAGALVVTPDAVTVGASGAVFGLMGATFLEMRHRGMDPMAGGAFGSIGGLILINLVFSFAISGISIGGHIGGLIGGGLVALAYQQAGRLRQPALAYAGAVAVAAVAAVIGIVAAGSSGIG
ncbi:MAG: rhomboid family intramembrane serine protease [Solirubrobacteraceae bacterium]